MEEYTSSTIISRWIESFENFDDPYDFEFSGIIETKEYNKLNITQKIDFLIKKKIAFNDVDEGGLIPNYINPILKDVICKNVFGLIYLEINQRLDEYSSRIEFLIEGLDESHQVKIINKKIKKVNKKLVFMNDTLFSLFSIYGKDFTEENLQDFHLSFWDGRAPFGLRYKLLKYYILYDKEFSSVDFNETDQNESSKYIEYMESNNIDDVLYSYDYFSDYMMFIEYVYQFDYLKKAKKMIREGVYKRDIDCSPKEEKEEESELVWYDNDAPNVFLSEYSLNLFIYIYNQSNLQESPSFFSYLFKFFNKNLDGTYKKLLTSQRPGNYINFVNSNFEARVKGKILKGTDKKQEEYYLIFDENEKRFKERFSSRIT